MKYARWCFITISKQGKRVENMACSGGFLTNLELFGNVIKHCLKYSQGIASWIHSYFDNVMTKFMINNRTDA